MIAPANPDLAAVAGTSVRFSRGSTAISTSTLTPIDLQGSAGARQVLDA